jgi:hypothetical protein
VEQAQAWWQSVNRAVLQNFGLQQKTIRHAAIHVLAQNLQPVAHVEQFVSAVPALVAIDIGGQGKTVAGVYASTPAPTSSTLPAGSCPECGAHR